MALMGISHHQWGVAFGVLGNIISILVFLAPVPTFYRIFKKKSTESFQSLPYLVALFSSLLWLYYAFLKGNAFLLITINSFGCFVETIYIIMYIAYAPKEGRKSTIKLFAIMNLGAFFFIFIVTHYLIHGDDTRILVLGWICVALSVSVFAAPLSIVAQVIRTKSVKFMPFNLSFFLTLSAIMWFGYGLFQKDICIALPNILGFVLGLLQMILYAIYTKASKITEEKNLPEEPLKNIVILGTLGASEVYPVDIPVEAKVNGDILIEEAKHNEQIEEPQKPKISLEVISKDGVQQNEICVAI